MHIIGRPRNPSYEPDWCWINTKHKALLTPGSLQSKYKTKDRESDR